MRDLLKHTRDVYEQRYGEEICRNFGRYRDFWNKYIGQRKDNRLRHYEIDSLKTRISQFDDKYEKMTLLHYGVFVDLVGIRIDFGRLLKNSYKITEDKLSYWNDVRNIYSKMGDSIYKYITFLDYVRKILNMGKRLNSIMDDMQKDLKLIKNKRDYIVHFATLPFAEDRLRGIKKIPRKIYKNNKPLPYSQVLKQNPRYWIPVEMQIEYDLGEIERTFNRNHAEVLELFGKYKKFEIIDPGPIDDITGVNIGKTIENNMIISSSASGDGDI